MYFAINQNLYDLALNTAKASGLTVGQVLDTLVFCEIGGPGEYARSAQ